MAQGIRVWRSIPREGLAASGVAGLLLFWSHAALAAPVARPVPAEAMQHGGLFFPGAEPGTVVAAPLLFTEIEVDVSGLVARYRMRHGFANTGTAWSEAIYTFPLPVDAAVDRLRMTVGERVIDGDIQERAAARQTYEAARAEGQRASLVEQHRANIFTTSVANIAPGAAVTVEIGFQESLAFKDGDVTLRLPLVIGPRYIPGNRLPDGFTGVGWSSDTDRVPDASHITPPVREPGEPLANPVSVQIRLDPGFPLGALESISHVVDVTETGGNKRLISLAKGAAPADRDLLLRWRPAPGAAPNAAIFAEQVGRYHYALLMVVPPASDAVRHEPAAPREVVFVIDTSGSMEGLSILQARQAVRLAIKRLQTRDRFNVIQFNDRPTTLFRAAVPATPENVLAAEDYVRDLGAGGGTRIVAAVDAALDGRSDSRRLRQVVLITDGAVGNEDEVISLIDRRIGDSRLFTVGIGSVPNDLLMTRAARAGRGAHTFIGDIEEVGERMNELFAKLENPVLTDLRITWPGRDPEYFPNPVPDLFAGEPVVVAARLDGPGGIAHLSGRLGGNIWRQDIAVPAGAGNPGVAAIWARAKIRRFNEQMRAGAEPDAVRLAITDVALDHRMLSKYTSLIAVDPMPARPADEDLHRSAIATNLPHGWTHEGVFGEKALERRAFLRSPAGTPIVLAASGIAAAPMPQTATAAEIHLLWALFLFGLAGMAYFAFRPWRRR